MNASDIITGFSNADVLSAEVAIITYNDATKVAGCDHGSIRLLWEEPQVPKVAVLSQWLEDFWSLRRPEVCVQQPRFCQFTGGNYFIFLVC